MSRVNYHGAHWSVNFPIFTICRLFTGPLSIWHGTAFGASCASAILGPDLAMPGQQLGNPPTATGPLWNQLLLGGPPATFTQDTTFIAWVRGHLINGRWGGPGNTWHNLTPLTAVANANHATVEGFIDNFINASYAYETAALRTHWYGVYYCVQCSLDPFAAPGLDNAANLYAYAPAFIKVTWRAVAIVKPINQNPNLVAGAMNAAPFAAVPALPFLPPIIPPIMGGAMVLPAGNIPGGLLRGALPAGFPAAQPNGFDSEIEIHQT